MKVRIASAQAWLSGAEKAFPCSIPPYTFRTTQESLDIVPSVTEHRHAFVLGGDWIPVYLDGAALIEGMIHTPSIYLSKGRRIRKVDGTLMADLGTRMLTNDTVILVGGYPNYYHWLIDHLPRLLYTREARPIQAGERILVNTDLAPFQTESLAMLGLGEAALLRVGDQATVYPRKVIVPRLLTHTTVPHPSIPKLLRQAFPAKTDSHEKRRIYLSRADANVRRLTNEKGLEAVLAELGFETHVPGQLTFQEQIDLCSQAEVVLAAHGAALANMVFCPPGTKIFELFTPLHRVTSMQLLAKRCGHAHHFVAARNVTVGEKDGNPLLGDWEADLEAVRDALASAGIQQ